MSSSHKKHSDLRLIPKVDELLANPSLDERLASVPRWIIVDAVRAELEFIRQRILEGADAASSSKLLDRPLMLIRINERIDLSRLNNLRRVVNGTGIIIHTNLGRAILAEEAVRSLVEAARFYGNLEFDLHEGRRGSRHAHLKDFICRLTGAEDALVVNNNAGAVLLALNTLSRGREAIISRGELIEIGGSFRIPDVMARSGAQMREVGTTNRTHLKDYEKAISSETGLLLKVHTSNYRVIGFTREVPLEKLVALGAANGIPVMEDLGSGCLVDLSSYGLVDEPPVRRSIEAGADLVTFSGDKLLGGPQAGIIVGKKQLVSLLTANPLHRALRIDKFTAAALEATLRLYLDGERSFSKIPVLAMIAVDMSDLNKLGGRMLKKWRAICPGHLNITLEETCSQVGGGALPMQDLPSMAFALVSRKYSANELESRFRAFSTPIIGRILDDRYLIDLRTLRKEDFSIIQEALEHLPQ